MKRNNLLPKDWLDKWGCREMSKREIDLLRIQDRDDYEYYVCENWLKYLTNYISYDKIERELQNSINIEFEIKIATKQNQSIKKYKSPIVKYNLEKGQRVDVRSTLRSGMARYKAVSFEKTIKHISSRKINPFCSWRDRENAKEKIYGLLSTQNDSERVFINFVACARNSTITRKNAVVWFIDLDFDMFKARRKNFYPIISHNLALAYCSFINQKNAQDKARVDAQISDEISGIEHLFNLI